MSFPYNNPATDFRERTHMNNIINLLNLEDKNIEISKIERDNNAKIKYIHVCTKASARFCPICNMRMHSRGTRQRTVNHPMLQDGYELIVLLKQRRWKCTNPACGLEMNEGFNFVNPRRRFSNASDFLILEAFKDLSKSARAIAKEFKSSDSHVLKVFDKYVNMERLPLTDAICIDEVHMEMDSKCKYVLILQDFRTGEPIDMLISRRSEITHPYFSGIPISERRQVKYLISDMYNPYLEYVNKYFPSAVNVVDSFHVSQWINNAITNYIRELIRDLRKEIGAIKDDLEAQGKKPHEIKNALKLPSDKLYLLQKKRWLVTKNQKNVNYQYETFYDRHFNCQMNTYRYEDLLFKHYPKLKDLRDLKERYITFNSRNAGKPEQAALELDELISFYAVCGEPIFVNFSQLLKRFRQPIINSFIMMTKIVSGDKHESRLSNGPMESLNRKAKDLKRLCRGFSNFEHLRNRFLFAARTNPALDGKDA